MAAVDIIQLVATILGMSSIIVGVFFSLLSLRNYNKARNLSLFMQYHTRAGSVDFLTHLIEINTTWNWKSTEEFWKKYGPENDPAAFAKFVSVGSYYDSMGMLLKTKNISVKYIPELMITAILTFWEKVSPYVEEMSIAFRRPESFENIKYLYDEIQKHALIIAE